MCSNLWSSDCVLVGLYVIRGDLGLYFGLLFFLRLVWTNFASLVLLDNGTGIAWNILYFWPFLSESIIKFLRLPDNLKILARSLPQKLTFLILGVLIVLNNHLHHFLLRTIQNENIRIRNPLTNLLSELST